MNTKRHNQPVQQGRILVVEDEPLVAATLQRVLAIDRYSADVAPDGERALAMLDSCQYDLIITDFQLGKMDGLEVAEAVKKRRPAVPVILITAYAERVQEKMGKVSNVDLLISKPFSVVEVREGVARLLSASA